MELQTLEKEWNIWQPIWKICILDHNSQKCIKFQCTKDVNVLDLSPSSQLPAPGDLEVSLAAVVCNETFSAQMRMLIPFVTFHFKAIWGS